MSRARGADIAKPTVDLSIYGHVSSVIWVAKDLDPVLNYWEKLGLKNIERTKVTEFTGLIYRGQAGSDHGQIRLRPRRRSHD